MLYAVFFLQCIRGKTLHIINGNFSFKQNTTLLSCIITKGGKNRDKIHLSFLCNEECKEEKQELLLEYEKLMYI